MSSLPSDPKAMLKALELAAQFNPLTVERTHTMLPRPGGKALIPHIVYIVRIEYGRGFIALAMPIEVTAPEKQHRALESICIRQSFRELLLMKDRFNFTVLDRHAT